jgi:hypothetical protein
MPDSLVAIEQEMLALIRRAHSIGVTEGRKNALSSILQLASSTLDVVATDPPYQPKVEKLPRALDVVPRSRAPHGQVQQHVLRVLTEFQDGIAQADIIPGGQALGLEIKPSSMRMALPALQKMGVVEFRDGKWFPKGNGAPTGAPPPEQPSVEAASEAARKVGGT